MPPNGIEFYEVDRDSALEARHPGSCEWIRGHPQFERWRLSGANSQSTFLRINAVPGAGKTVLSAFLTLHARPAVSVGVSSPLYFFFRGEDKNKGTASAAAKSLLFQALGRAKWIPGLYEQMLEAVLLPAA